MLKKKLSFIIFDCYKAAYANTLIENAVKPVSVVTWIKQTSLYNCASIKQIYVPALSASIKHIYVQVLSTFMCKYFKHMYVPVLSTFMCKY